MAWKGDEEVSEMTGVLLWFLVAGISGAVTWWALSKLRGWL